MVSSRIAPRATGDGRERPRALETGGGVRVGRAIALAWARAGIDVAIGYHRSAGAARRVVAEVVASGAHMIAIRVPYTLSKTGIESLTRGLAGALRSRGAAVNCVATGAVLQPPDSRRRAGGR